MIPGIFRKNPKNGCWGHIASESSIGRKKFSNDLWLVFVLPRKLWDTFTNATHAFNSFVHFPIKSFIRLQLSYLRIFKNAFLFNFVSLIRGNFVLYRTSRFAYIFYVCCMCWRSRCIIVWLVDLKSFQSTVLSVKSLQLSEFSCKLSSSNIPISPIFFPKVNRQILIVLCRNMRLCYFQMERLSLFLDSWKQLEHKNRVSGRNLYSR